MRDDALNFSFTVAISFYVKKEIGEKALYLREKYKRTVSNAKMIWKKV